MKKFLKFATIIVAAFVFTSCSVESKTKGYLEKIQQYKVENAELEVEMLEEGVDYYEYLEDLDKKDLRKIDKNVEKWRKEVYDDYNKEKKALEKEKTKILEKSYKIWDDKIFPRILKVQEEEE